MGNFPFFLLCFLALHFLLNSVHKSAAFQSDTPTESSNHFHIVEVSSLLPASTCSPSSATVSSEEEFLKLVHYYGPCSLKNLKYGKANAPSMREILERDQQRVSFMVSRQLHGKNKVQVRLDSILNFGEYVVNVGLGTPKRKFTLLIDTGSSLIWTQCQPCKLENHKGCYKQRHPIFDPSTSSTYTNITCPSQICSMANTTLATLCDSSTCVYNTAYGDGARIVGFLATESVSVGSKTFDDIIFGCTEVNNGINVPVNIDGILGLGQDFLSFVEQTAEVYKRVFSYCLPSKSSEIGFLKFGKAKEVSESLKFTRLGVANTIELVGIKLGKTTIPIAVVKGAAFIDSGTTISRIPPEAYSTLREAYRKAMSHYQLAKPFEILDTCYHIGGYQNLKLPKMSFLFADGLVLDIPPSGVALPINSNLVCLPFARPPGDIDIVLFGNIQQKTLEIVYDVAGGKLGFGYHGCK